VTLDVVYKMALPFSCSFSSAQVSCYIVSVISLSSMGLKRTKHQTDVLAARRYCLKSDSVTALREGSPGERGSRGSETVSCHHNLMAESVEHFCTFI